MKLIFKKESDLHPENMPELEAISKKWKISLNELSRAIVETGTTNIIALKAHIRKGKISWMQQYSFKKFYSGMYIVNRD